jgi:hypothetical protein
VNLGLLLIQQGETEAGTKLLAHAYAVFQKALGPNHPYTRDLADWFEKNLLRGCLETHLSASRFTMSRIMASLIIASLVVVKTS